MVQCNNSLLFMDVSMVGQIMLKPLVSLSMDDFILMLLHY